MAPRPFYNPLLMALPDLGAVAAGEILHLLRQVPCSCKNILHDMTMHVG